MSLSLNLKERIVGTYGTLFYVRDMARSLEFYREALDLTPAFENSDWAEIPVPGHNICLHITTGAASRANDPATSACVILKVRGIRDCIAELKSRGVEFSRDLHEVHPGAYSADFADLDGNKLSLYEYERE